MDVREAKDRHVDALMAVPGVVGVGVGQSGEEAVIVVLVRSRIRAGTLPPALEGYSLVIEEVGRLDTPELH